MNVVLSRSLSGVFCEDIRQELFGKKTLVGCYTGVMEASEFPITLPKLCIHGIVQSPGDRPMREVKLLVLKDDDVLGEGALPEIPLQEPLPAEGDYTVQRLAVEFVFSPLVIDKPCVLRVRAHVDGEELRGLALHVRQAGAPIAQEPVAEVAAGTGA